MDIVLATRNIHKINEIKEILKDISVTILTLNSFSDIPQVIEDGETFLENALKKSTTISKLTNRITIADDSGLEVNFLGGRPGVYSARYAGRGVSDEDNNCKLLKELKGVPWQARKAAFKCVISLSIPCGTNHSVEGKCRGIIGLEPKGERGFGYDPLFFFPELQKTFAELNPILKNRISHRAKALRQLKPLLLTYCKDGY